MGVPTRLGRYVVRRRLGSGGFATVWLAYDEQLDAEVAVKVLADNWAHDDSVRRRFLEEGRFLRRVESEHVVQVHDVGEMEDGRPFLVLTYADRGTLADRLKKEPLPLEPAVGVIVQVGRGLQALHRRGLLHRDVKPANVLFRSIDDDGERAVLSDLGLGKSLDEVSRITMPGGTPSYVAPEQAMGERLDQRADQYSLGAVAYAALTGRSPHQVDGLGAAGRVKAPSPPSSLGFEVPERVDAAIVRALDPDREKRWPDIESFTRELVGSLDETTQNFVVGSAAGTTVPRTIAVATTVEKAQAEETEPGEKTALSESNAPTVVKTGTTTVPADATGKPDAAAAAAAGKTADSDTAAASDDQQPAQQPGQQPAQQAGQQSAQQAGAQAGQQPVLQAGQQQGQQAATAASAASAGTVAVPAAAQPGQTDRPAAPAQPGQADQPGASAQAGQPGAAAQLGEAGQAGATGQGGRRRGAWVVAAVLALVVGAGAGFGVQRYLEATQFTEVSKDNFSVRLPHEWATVITTSTWRPAGAKTEQKALRVSQDDRWSQPGSDTPGVFVGLLGSAADPQKALPNPKQYGCTDTSSPSEGTQISRNCANGTTLLQRVVGTGNGDSMLIQVQVPGGESEKKAIKVADSVTFSS